MLLSDAIDHLLISWFRCYYQHLTNICDRCYSHIGLLLLTNNNNTYRWPDVKPLCFGLDVIDHVLWIRK